VPPAPWLPQDFCPDAQQGRLVLVQKLLSSVVATVAPPQPSMCGCGRTTASQVTLVEPNANFVSCPISNLVLGGVKTMADITSQL
jgi:hypothetical protein